MAAGGPDLGAPGRPCRASHTRARSHLSLAADGHLPVCLGKEHEGPQECPPPRPKGPARRKRLALLGDLLTKLLLGHPTLWFHLRLFQPLTELAPCLYQSHLLPKFKNSSCLMPFEIPRTTQRTGPRRCCQPQKGARASIAWDGHSVTTGHRGTQAGPILPEGRRKVAG